MSRPNIFVASLEARHFSFVATGLSEDEALKDLADGWNHYAHEYNVSGHFKLSDKHCLPLFDVPVKAIPFRDRYHVHVRCFAPGTALRNRKSG